MHFSVLKSMHRVEREGEEIKALAEEKGIYVEEAIWTRYMPSGEMIQDIIASEIIGDIKTVTCNLAYPISHVERIIRPELAGGALLDVGVYGLNFIIMHLGKDFAKLESSVTMTETGVDGQESIIFHYSDGKLAVTTHSIYVRSDRRGILRRKRIHNCRQHQQFAENRSVRHGRQSDEKVQSTEADQWI